VRGLEQEARGGKMARRSGLHSGWVFEMPNENIEIRLHEALQPLPEELRADAVLCVAERMRAGTQVSSRDALFRSPTDDRKYYAIQDDDVELLKESAAAAAAVLAGFPDPMTFAGALVYLGYRARKKHIALDASDAVVLIKAKKHGNVGASVDEIATALGIGSDEVAHSISRLKEARRFDGTSAPLIEQSGDRYVAIDV